jgi:hypothetical protein
MLSCWIAGAKNGKRTETHEIIENSTYHEDIQRSASRIVIEIAFKLPERSLHPQPFGAAALDNPCSFELFSMYWVFAEILLICD